MSFRALGRAGSSGLCGLVFLPRARMRARISALVNFSSNLLGKWSRWTAPDGIWWMQMKQLHRGPVQIWCAVERWDPDVGMG